MFNCLIFPVNYSKGENVMYCTTPDYLTITDSIISHATRMKILC